MSDTFITVLLYITVTAVVLMLLLLATQIDVRKASVSPDDPKTWMRYDWDSYAWFNKSPTEEDYLKTLSADRYGNPAGWHEKVLLKQVRKSITTIAVEPKMHKRYYDNTTLYKLPEYPALSASIHDKYCEHKMLSNVNYYEENPEKSLYYYG